MSALRIVLPLGVLAVVLAGFTSGCVVEARPAPYGHCPGGYWVAGHYGPHGRWHPGHWRCPGVIERVEID